MSELTKQSKNRDRKSNWKILFARSTEKSRRENLETKERVNDLKHRMFKIEQALNIKN